MKRKTLLFVPIIAISVLCSTVLAADVEETRDLLRELITAKWGAEQVLLPSPKVLVQYEADLGERRIVDFESGEVVLECLWPEDTALNDTAVHDAMSCAISNLYVSTPVLPGTMLKKQQQAGYIPARVNRQGLKQKGNSWVYTVRKGDTISEISRRFRVSSQEIVHANNLRNANRINIKQELIIPDSPPHIHLPGEEHATARESLLHNQLIDPDSGKQIDAKSVGAFGKRTVQRNGIEGGHIRGGDGQTRTVSRVKLSLAEKHLQVRAGRYYSMVCEYANKFGHDPAIIMAMVHTESAFNPMAASAANAYGLMQLVPSSGGREAYRWLHKKDIAPSPGYLMRPRENIELGTAYMKILQERIFKGVTDPSSRLYCAIAAYNCGGGNVGRAFTGRKSVRSSLASINAATPEQVLKRLQTNAPKETRNYVQHVFNRANLYRSPEWSNL